MNQSIRPFIYRTNLIDREILLVNFIHVDYLTDARSFYFAVVTIEAIFCALAVCVSMFLIIKAMQHPPMHINPCLITYYNVIITSISNGTRIGQILYESGVISTKDGIPTSCVVISFFRVYGLISMTRYSLLIFKERCLALRFVRDYEWNRRLHFAFSIILLDVVVNTTLVILIMLDILPFYKIAWIALIPCFGVYFTFKRLLAQNEKRLDRLNQRVIRRPSVQGKLPKKFFGDSSKDMYTLSLRLQLDENIWCCKQLSRGSYIFIVGISVMLLILTVPPMFTYTRENIETLMIIMTIGNLLIPISTIIVHSLIALSLDKLRPLIIPACLYNFLETRRKRKMRGSKAVTTESQIAPDSDSRYSRETSEYFGRLSDQWETSFDNIYI